MNNIVVRNDVEIGNITSIKADHLYFRPIMSEESDRYWIKEFITKLSDCNAKIVTNTMTEKAKKVFVELLATFEYKREKNSKYIDIMNECILYDNTQLKEQNAKIKEPKEYNGIIIVDNTDTVHGTIQYCNDEWYTYLGSEVISDKDEWSLYTKIMKIDNTFRLIGSGSNYELFNVLIIEYGKKEIKRIKQLLKYTEGASRC